MTASLTHTFVTKTQLRKAAVATARVQRFSSRGLAKRRLSGWLRQQTLKAQLAMEELAVSFSVTLPSARSAKLNLASGKCC